MPLETQIIGLKGPTDTVIPEGGWDGNALNCFLTAALHETDPNLEIREDLKMRDITADTVVNWEFTPIYYLEVNNPLWKSGRYKLQHDHTYKIDDERTIHFKKGYTLVMHRVSRNGN